LQEVPGRSVVKKRGFWGGTGTYPAYPNHSKKLRNLNRTGPRMVLRGGGREVGGK